MRLLGLIALSGLILGFIGLIALGTPVFANHTEEHWEQQRLEDGRRALEGARQRGCIAQEEVADVAYYYAIQFPERAVEEMIKLPICGSVPGFSDTSVYAAAGVGVVATLGGIAYAVHHSHAGEPAPRGESRTRVRPKTRRQLLERSEPRWAGLDLSEQAKRSQETREFMQEHRRMWEYQKPTHEPNILQKTVKALEHLPVVGNPTQATRAAVELVSGYDFYKVDARGIPMEVSRGEKMREFAFELAQVGYDRLAGRYITQHLQERNVRLGLDFNRLRSDFLMNQERYMNVPLQHSALADALPVVTHRYGSIADRVTGSVIRNWPQTGEGIENIRFWWDLIQGKV